MKRLKGSVTIFLALFLGVILVFLSAIRESAMIGIDKSYERGVAQLAVESVFAEYHTRLLEEFHIFAIDATYESGIYSMDNLKERLEVYGMEDVEWEVTQLQLLTDENGAAFEEQIICYMEQLYGGDYLDVIFGSWEMVEVQRVEGEAMEEEQTQLEEELVSQVEAIKGEEEALVEAGEEVSMEVESVLENEYIEQLSFLANASILTLVVPTSWEVSQANVEEGVLASTRELETGIASYELDSGSQVLRQMMISEYVLDHFYCATQVELEDLEEEDMADSEVDVEASQLQYEVEYILAGKDSDEENLAEVVNQLLLMRTGVNYTCISQSATKKAEVSTLALAIATAAGYPLLADVLEQVLLVGWAYGESILDVRNLLSGGQLTLLKQEEDWQLSLSGLLNLANVSGDSSQNLSLESTANSSDSTGQEESEEGYTYREYLRLLLYLEEKDDQLVRALDVIEQRLQYTWGLEYFQVDACVTQLEYQNISTVTGGFTYEFPVAFTYR